MITDMISEYFRRRLAEFGYVDELTIYWSLSYCQGDGMAFYGKLYEESLVKLADRLLSTGTQKAAIKRAINKGAAIMIESVSNHYSHWNTMRVWNSDSECDPLTPFEESAWDELLEGVREDVQRISRALEKEGYKLREACSPRWWWKHEGEPVDEPEWGVKLRDEEVLSHFTLLVYLFDNDYYNPYANKTEYDHEDVLALVQGKSGACRIMVEIWDFDDDNLIVRRDALVDDARSGERVRDCAEMLIEDAKSVLGITEKETL